MQKKSEDFSPQEAMRLAKTPAAQQLLAMLQQQNTGQLEKIMAMAKSGDMTSAGNALQGLLSSPDARKLIRQLEDDRNG